MIGYLEGKVRERSSEVVILDVQGVGYEVHVPTSTYYEIEKAGTERPVGLHIYTHLREGGLTLFGFWSRDEKEIFQRLLGVGGVGPRLARAVLSGMSAEDLLGAIASADIAKLSSIPGVGKKTAQRLSLELKDKVADLGPAETPGAPRSPTGDDLVSALVNLGYKEGQAERAARATREENPDAPLPELLRRSLKRLSRA